MLGTLQFVAWLGVAGLFAKMSLKKRVVGEGPRARTERFIHIPTVAMGVAALVLSAILLSSFGTVGAGERGVVLRFGATTGRIVNPGLYYVTPVLESVHRMNVQVQKETAKAAAASKDLQSVTTEVALNYSLSPDKVARLYREIGDDFKSRVIDPAIQEAVKSVTAKYNAESLISERHLVKERLTGELVTRLDTLGILVEAISITDFAFSAEFTQAIEAKTTATQQALKAENDLKRIEFEAKQRVATATGEAEAIRIQAQAIQNQGGAAYVQLKAIEKWDGSVPQWVTGSGAVPFINMSTPK